MRTHRDVVRRERKILSTVFALDPATANVRLDGSDLLTIHAVERHDTKHGTNQVSNTPVGDPKTFITKLECHFNVAGQKSSEGSARV